MQPTSTVALVISIDNTVVEKWIICSIQELGELKLVVADCNDAHYICLNHAV